MENRLVSQKKDLIESPILEAITAPKIIDEPLYNIAAHIKRLFMMLGISGNNVPQDLEFDFLVKTYKLSFSQFTLKEIELAFKLAINLTIDFNLNLYDKMFSVIYVSDLMKQYVEWKKQSTTYQKSKRHEDPEKSEEEKELILKNATIRAFEMFKKGNDSDCRFYLYNFLDKKGIINLTNERKKEFMLQAETELKEEAKRQKDMAISTKEIKKIIENFDSETLLKNRAKELALKDYFTGLIELEININEQI